MKLILKFFKVSPSQIKKTRDKYRNLTSDTAEWLLKIGQTFFEGYNATLANANFLILSQMAERVPDELRGFFYEGIGAGLTLKDFLRFWVREEQKTYFYTFLNQYGLKYQEVMYVGMGMSYGRTRLSPNNRLSRIDQNYRRFLLDGYAFFKLAVDHIDPKEITIPKWVLKKDLEFYYLGLGRCLWFIESGNTNLIQKGIKEMDQNFLDSIWQGLGVSMTYAGKASLKDLKEFHQIKKEEMKQLTYGSLTACEMRIRGNNPSKYSTFVYEALRQS